MEKTKKSLVYLLVGSVLCLLLSACASVATPPQSTGGQQLSRAASFSEQESVERAVGKSKAMDADHLPVRYQKPSYLLTEAPAKGMTTDEEVSIPVGADISSNTGPIALRDILKRLAVLKGMNISWASDVDQYAVVDVDIRAEDDFFRAIDNILRQKDYFHEVQGNTILVKYRETRKFQIAMPFVKSAYNIGVGGDVLGSGGVGGQSAGKMTGAIQIKSDDNKFDIWENVAKNLDQILEIWEETVVSPPAAAAGAGAPAAPAAQTTTTKRNVQAGKGYYTIDKPIGLITVTAPRPLVEKIAAYIDGLKKELFRQVVIEAKIVEVIINDTEKKGIDWSRLADSAVNLEMFGPTGAVYKPGTSEKLISGVNLSTNPFQILLSALQTQGPTNVLANPKISTMNGQPALISVGENVRFIEKVETTTTETTTTTSVTTNSVMSGLGLSVVATIMGDDEIVLNMTPVTSSLTKMDERTFGANGGMLVQLPTVSVREMNTLVRIKNGDILMVGGLIDSNESSSIKKVPFFGDIPVVKNLFSHSSKTDLRKELVVLLQPKII